MNALQIIEPNPLMNVRRSGFRFRLSDAIILLALVAGMSMSRGEEAASEPGATMVTGESRDKAGGNEKSGTPATQPAADAAAAKIVPPSGTNDEKAPAPAQASAPSAADIKGDSKGVSDGGKSAAAQSKLDTTETAAIKDDKKQARNAVAARSAESARPVHRSRSAIDYRSSRSKSADAAPVRVGLPPVIYGPRPETKVPVMDPAGGMKRQDRMLLPTKPSLWDRVVDAPGAVLNGGKQAFYDILDTVW